MAKTRIVVKWPDLVSSISKEYGVPKKQIEESVAFFADGVNLKVEENREKLKTTGDKLTVVSPLGTFNFTKVPEQTIEDKKTGKKKTVSPSLALSWGPTRNTMETANPNVKIGEVESKPIGSKAG